MRIAVFGTGGAGGYFGAQLALAGEDVVFSELSAKGASALVVLNTPVFDMERQRIVDLAAKNRRRLNRIVRGFQSGQQLKPDPDRRRCDR
jgi:UDP-glucose 6-dehydrogenase